jgi:hypothetical protein
VGSKSQASKGSEFHVFPARSYKKRLGYIILQKSLLPWLQSQIR